jgi:hypothetical protein
VHPEIEGFEQRCVASVRFQDCKLLESHNLGRPARQTFSSMVMHPIHPLKAVAHRSDSIMKVCYKGSRMSRS